MEKYLIHSNELHLIDAEKIHQAVEKMVESLDLAAGSTTNFDLYPILQAADRISHTEYNPCNPRSVTT